MFSLNLLFRCVQKITLNWYCTVKLVICVNHAAMEERSQHEHNHVHEVITKHCDHLKLVTAPLDKIIGDLSVTMHRWHK